MFYVPGNHDDSIRGFVGFDLGTIEILEEAIHNTQSGKRFLVIHGDQFDLVVGTIRWLAVVGAVIYGWLLALNHVVHLIRTLFGMRYWSLAASLKKKAKSAVNHIQNFEEAALRHATDLHCDGVVCGHIHTPKLATINGMIYANCGDWVESMSCVVENKLGELEVLYLNQIQS